MQPLKAFFAAAGAGALCVQTAPAQAGFGAQGAEGEPNRMQQWLVPSPDPDIAGARAAVSPARRRAVSAGGDRARLDAERAASRANAAAGIPRAGGWLVARGFAVLVPERPGHGATGGRYLEDQGGCDEADYARAGRATADEIAAALGFMRKQSFIRPDGMVDYRPLGRRLGRAGAGRRKSERHRGHHRLRAGPRRPRQ